MIDYRQTIRMSLALLSSLLLLALPACSDEEGGGEVLPVEEQYAKLVISLGSLDNATPVYTKTVDDVTNPDEPDEAYERHIKDWWIVVMHDEKVEQVLSNEKGDQAVVIGGDQNEHQVSVELLIDETYDFYAFANLPQANQTYLEGLVQGKTFDIKQTVATIDAKSYNSGTIANGPYFPMSSYKYSVKVQSNNPSLEIPLIRLLGKVEVEITNSTDLETLIVNGLTLNKFRTTGPIYLLPYDEAENEGTKNLLKEDMESSYVPLFPKLEDDEEEDFAPVTLITEENPASIEKGKTGTFWSYVNETNFMTIETGLNNLQVTVDIDDRDDSPKDTNFDFIRRNDWLKIPLLLSDVSTTIEFNMERMPIGGVPATITIPEGLTIPQATFWTQEHGGDITITYNLNSISSLQPGAQILHYNTGDSFEGNEQHPFTSAVLESNDNDLLISTEAHPLPTNNTYAQWLDTSAKAFDLSSNEDGASGSFTVTAQELSGNTEARIRLTLVIEGKDANGKDQKVVVPYTIIIKNKKSNDWETTTGGN